MNNTKNDTYYVERVIDNIDTIISYVANCSFDEFIDNEMLIDAVMFRLVQMAENIGKISNSYKENHKDIQWGLIAGFRNGIVHDYGKTDYNIVWEIISGDIYDLRMKLTE